MDFIKINQKGHTIMKFSNIDKSEFKIKDYTFKPLHAYSYDMSFSAIAYLEIKESLLNESVEIGYKFTVIAQENISYFNYNKKDDSESDNPHIERATVITLSIAEENRSSEIKRQSRYFKERLESGFDNSDIWNLDSTTIRFLILRLEELKEFGSSWYYQGREVTCREICEDILKGFYLYLEHSFDIKQDRKTYRTIRHSFKVFRDNFESLWT